jgi:aminomuconate-semialdehyde/2-hydroxymuconate-6-semialdehyde dehydrogenase
MTVIPHVIDGEEVESAGGARFDTVDPWTRSPWAQVALGGAPEVERALAAARRAFDDGPWPRMGFAERGAALHRLADLLLAHAAAPTPATWASRSRTPAGRTCLAPR